MSTKPNQVTDVVVSVHLTISNPLLPIIGVKEVITGGKGTLTETIFGGQVKLHLELKQGEAVGKLEQGELVYVRGLRGGEPFSINQAMTTDKATQPWEFSRVSGSTG
jgi:hypothetical protein